MCFGTAYAGAFQFWQQSGESVGDYAAGAAASADDATTSYYNPAGLTRIKHQDMALSGIANITNSRFKGNATTTTINNFTNNSGTVQGGDIRYIPTLLYAAPISNNWGFGFSVTTPFISRIDYNRYAFTRYALIKSKMDVTDISPALAYKTFGNISIGAGVDYQYLDYSYDQIDTNNTIANDSISSNHIDSWAWGWNAGLLWEALPTTRVGLAYRSKVVHEASGGSDLNGPLTNNVGRVTHAKARIVLPPSVTLSAYHELTPKIILMGTINYTQWAVLKNLILTNIAAASGTSQIVVQRNFKNSWRFAIGPKYKMTEKLTLRGGLGFDQAATKEKYRSVSLVDSNRYIVAFGVGYRFTKTIGVDLGYSHVFMQRTRINRANIYGAENVMFDGNMDNSSDIIGFQLNWEMT